MGGIGGAGRRHCRDRISRIGGRDQRRRGAAAGLTGSAAQGIGGRVGSAALRSGAGPGTAGNGRRTFQNGRCPE